MKILITPRSFGKSDPGALDLLRGAGLELEANSGGRLMERGELAAKIADCAGVVVGVESLDAEMLSLAPGLRAVAKYGVGVDNIDLAECERRGVKVSITAGANADAVADYAFALILGVARRVAEIDARCRRRDWSKLTGLDVFGKTLGLLGLGAVGKGVAARARGFSMRVLAHDVYWDESYAAAAGVEKASPERIYAEADFISLHVPLLPATRGLIGRRELAAMKPTAILINTARGGIIDEPALLEALKTRRIFGAGLDAFAEEPPRNPEWLALDNLVLGAHSAASTDGATGKMSRLAAENLIRDLGL